MAILPVAAELARRSVLTELNTATVSRYSRHILLPEVGRDGQKRLQAARVLIVGAGGLGSPVALYLAAAGIGVLGLVDGDCVDASNLQRQVLYREADVGQPKVVAAAAALKQHNSAIEIELHQEMLTPEKALALVSAYDLVIDGTDNFPTRYMVSDACVLAGRPYIYGSISRFAGQTSVFYPPHGPCYRCLFPTPPASGLVPSCAEGGVFGVLPGVIGSIQATETIKVLLGIGEPLLGRFLTYDALAMKWSELRLQRDPKCQVCGDHPTITSVTSVAASCEVVSSASVTDTSSLDISVDELQQMRAQRVTHLLVDVRSAGEASICQIKGSKLVPMSELPTRVDELPRDQRIVVYCKVGSRSSNAVKYLCEQGFINARSLRGGIIAWIDSIDGTLARY